MSVSGATTLTGGLNTPLAVTSGGTGVATSTGSGAVVLNTSPTIATSLTVTGATTAHSFIPNLSTVPTNGMYLPAANSVGIATNSTARLVINSSGNVAIQPPSASTTAFNVVGVAGSTVVDAAGTAVGTCLPCYKVQNLDLTAGSTAGIYFFSGDDGTLSRTRAIIDAGSDVTNNGYLAFRTRNAGSVVERMRIAGTGGVSIGNTTDPGATNLSVTGTGNFGTTVGVGAATPSTSGAGITFPATQSASTNANTLDDYEEGTWTPIVGGTATYNYQNGRYVKIGSVVTINCDISINVIGTGSTKFISGLPFASNTGTNAAINCGPVGYFAGVNSSVYFISVINAPGNSFVSFETLTAANSAANDAAAIFASGTRITFSMTYLTA
jgi:hypothetical protein